MSYFCVFLFRRKVQVDEIFVHENYTAGGSKENDIALLRLGEKIVWWQSSGLENKTNPTVQNKIFKWANRTKP